MSKPSKLRACPAVGRDITPAECGEHRNSRYVCPADCPHNPFAPANYTQLLGLEEALDGKCMTRLKEQAPDPAALDKAVQKARHDPSPHALHAFFSFSLFFGGAERLSCAQSWDQAGFAGLKNDERALLRAKMQMRVVLVEIHRVLDHERIEAVDLLATAPAPLRLQDRSLASMAVRFACALVWVYPLPHYWRLSGTAVLLPNWVEFEPRETVTEIVSHLGGSTVEPELRRWLAENFVRFDEALQATARMRRMQMFAGLDAKFGKAVYALQAPFAERRDRLDALPDVEPDQLAATEREEGFAEARVWFDHPAPGHHRPKGGRPSLGRVLLGQSHWRIEAFGAEQLANLRQQFETQLADRVRFSGERLDNLGATLAAKEPQVNESLVPPRLLEKPQRLRLTASRVPAPPPEVSKEGALEDWLCAEDRAFLDDHIPALNDCTPREAVRDPALRPVLIRLLKQRVRGQDERNLKSGRTDDINWLLRELGAEAILFEPPPWRPPPLTVGDPKDDEDDFEDEQPQINPHLPPAPPLPAEPLTVEEAAKRLDDAMAAFETAADAMDAITVSGATIIDDADALTVDWLNDNEFSFTVPFLLQTWLALIPPGNRAPQIRFEALEQTFIRTLQQLTDRLKAASPNAFMRFLDEGAQPALMQLLAVQVMEAAQKAPKKIRPRIETQPVILALLRAVVTEVDAALRP